MSPMSYSSNRRSPSNDTYVGTSFVRASRRPNTYEATAMLRMKYKDTSLVTRTCQFTIDTMSYISWLSLVQMSPSYAHW